MTVDSFKKEYPEHAHLEGDALWDMMTIKFGEKHGFSTQEEYDKYIRKIPGGNPCESYRFTILDIGKKKLKR